MTQRGGSESTFISSWGLSLLGLSDGEWTWIITWWSEGLKVRRHLTDEMFAQVSCWLRKIYLLEFPEGGTKVIYWRIIFLFQAEFSNTNRSVIRTCTVSAFCPDGQAALIQVVTVLRSMNEDWAHCFFLFPPLLNNHIPVSNVPCGHVGGFKYLSFVISIVLAFILFFILNKFIQLFARA